jgi:uncharacterized protein (DUF433 family)
MSQVISLRVPDQMVERLDKFARRLGNGMTRTKASVMLLEESLRESEFANIEYRDSIIGRQPYLKGSGLAIWEVIMIAKSFDFDVKIVAENYELRVEAVESAINFYKVYKDEIDQAISDNNIGFDEIKRQFPQARRFDVSKLVSRRDKAG